MTGRIKRPLPEGREDVMYVIPGFFQVKLSLMSVDNGKETDKGRGECIEY